MVPPVFVGAWGSTLKIAPNSPLCICPAYPLSLRERARVRAGLDAFSSF